MWEKVLTDTSWRVAAWGVAFGTCALERALGIGAVTITTDSGR